MSCNGCRVLRKGCSEECTLRPCLEWIKSPQSQANATLFLAKFYGRAGLINLIDAGPTHVRPEIFRSLLFEACGRIINPVYGSIGLMCSNNWHRCHVAVEAVLQGASLVMKPSPVEDTDCGPCHITPSQSTDIRHVSKEPAAFLHGVKTRQRFKRSGAKSCADSVDTELMGESDAKFTITGWDYNSGEGYKGSGEGLNRELSHDSFSVETNEPTLVNRVELPVRIIKPEPHLELELTLGMYPVRQTYQLPAVVEISDSES